MPPISTWRGRPIAEMDAPALRKALQVMADLHETCLENYRRHLDLLNRRRVAGPYPGTFTYVSDADIELGPLYTHAIAFCLGAAAAIALLWLVLK